MSINFIKIYKNCYFSNKISLYVKNAIVKKYGLTEKMEDPIICFFDYNDNDYEKILNYNNLIFLIWMNIDLFNKKLNNKIKVLINKKNIYHFATTKYLLKNLEAYKF